MISEMNTHDLKKITGFTDRQIDYLIRVIDVLKREKIQGKAREYSGHELALFTTIAKLKAEGVSIGDINKLLNVINENPGKLAAIAVYPMKNKKPIVKLELNVNEKEVNASLDTNPDVLLLFEGEWLSQEDGGNSFVMETWHSHGDQLELDLKQGVMNEA